MKYHQFTLILAIAFVLGACSKDSSTDNGTTSASAKTTTLTASAWMIQNVAFRVGSSDLPYSVDPCLMDNVFTFKSDNTGTMSEGTNVCTGSSPNTTFAWSFTNNETAMTLSGVSLSGVAGPFKVLELTSTKLSLGKDTTNSGISGTIIVNFKH